MTIVADFRIRHVAATPAHGCTHVAICLIKLGFACLHHITFSARRHAWPEFRIGIECAYHGVTETRAVGCVGIAGGATLIAILFVSGRSAIVYDEQVLQAAKFALAAYLFYLAFRSWERARQGAAIGGMRMSNEDRLLSNGSFDSRCQSDHCDAFRLLPDTERDALVTVILIALPVFVIAGLWFGLVAAVASLEVGGKMPQLVFNHIDDSFALVFVALAISTLSS